MNLLPFAISNERTLRKSALMCVLCAWLLSACGSAPWVPDAPFPETSDDVFSVWLDARGMWYDRALDERAPSGDPGRVLTAEHLQATGDRICERATELDRSGNAPVLAILVHGMSNTETDAVANYTAVRAATTDALPPAEQVIWLDVYWESTEGGLRGWKPAQRRARRAGVALRAVLNQLGTCQLTAGDPPPIRVLTHSSGAIAAAALVGSPSFWKDPEHLMGCAQPDSDCSASNRWYATHLRSSAPDDPYRRPERPLRVRLGTIASAIPSNAICHIEDSVCVQTAPAALDYWALGVNRRDAVTNKFVRMSRRFGATTMAGRAALRFFEDIESAAARSGWDTRFEYFSLSEPRTREHYWTTYIRSSGYGEFVRDVFHRDDCVDP